MQTAKRKNTFRDGRQGFIHLIREALPDSHVNFDYKDIMAILKSKYPNIMVRRTTLNQNLRSLEETREIKIVRIGHAKVPTIYKTMQQ